MSLIVSVHDPTFPVGLSTVFLPSRLRLWIYYRKARRNDSHLFCNLWMNGLFEICQDIWNWIKAKAVLKLHLHVQKNTIINSLVNEEERSKLITLQLHKTHSFPLFNCITYHNWIRNYYVGNVVSCISEKRQNICK